MRVLPAHIAGALLPLPWFSPSPFEVLRLLEIEGRPGLWPQHRSLLGRTAWRGPPGVSPSVGSSPPPPPP